MEHLKAKVYCTFQNMIQKKNEYTDTYNKYKTYECTVD